MQLNHQAVIKNGQASVVLDELDLQSYNDLISLRTLPAYEVIGNEIKFPPTYLDGYFHQKQELPLPITEKLFDYQKVIVKVSWIKERYAIFADAGLGKTYCFGELIRQIYSTTDKRIVVCAPLNILHQFEEMVRDFFPDFPQYEHIHNSRMTLDEWCHYGDTRIAFVNHEYFIKHSKQLVNVDAFLLDESSILKGGQGGNGKIAQNIIKASKGIRYKFAASATPAPNDRTEYAMTCLFLEYIRSEKEFYAQYFVNKDGQYVLKRHATEPFYRYLSYWSIFIRNPAAYGFENNLKDLLPWKEIYCKVPATPEQDKMIREYSTNNLQALLPGVPIDPGTMGQRNKFSQISKGFAYDDENGTRYVASNKPQKILDIVKKHEGEQIIIWVVYDEEGDILYKLLKDNHKVAHITGKTKDTDRVSLIDQFRHNELDVIISKPRILGFGLNFQFCHIAIYSGLSDSYEAYYQSVKRIHRYGQKEQVLIYHVYTSYEEAILTNVLGKQKTAKADFEYQEKLYIQSLADELKEFLTMDDYTPMKVSDITYEPVKTDFYQIYHGDSIKKMLEVKNGMTYGWLKPNGVDFSVFSPPFMGDLFTYTSDPADMGNTRGAGAEGGLDEFMMQFRFFLEGMLTVTKPGRLMAMHLEDVPLRKGLDGNVGLFDFVGQAIQQANKVGWILVGKIPIIKNQQMQSIVKHVANLTMTNMEKDRVRIAPAMNGYLCLFKKPGDNVKPIADLAKCHDCGWHGYANDLIGYDSAISRGYKSGDADLLVTFICPKCNSSTTEIYSEMNGDKWIIYAEGAWPEEGFNADFSKISKITRTERWLDLIQTALGVWFDIQESDTLQAMYKGDEDADKHLCPLPKTIARRAIEMYSMPGEVVFTPFLGIGTEADQAIRLGRRAVGVELKDAYFLQSIKNLEQAVIESTQMRLF